MRVRAPLRRARLALACLPVLLGACASIGSPGGRGERNWAEYAAGIYASPENQRFSAYAAAEREHTASPTADSALRLAILSLGLDRPAPDYEFVLSLLAFADGATENESTRAFAAFLRPLVQRLAGQQASLEAESGERRSLEQQLDALKALEEQLNAAGGL